MTEGTKKYLYQGLYLLALFLTEAAAMRVFAEAQRFVPQLVLLFVVVLARKENFAEVVWFSFAAGILFELFSGWYFGSYILAFLALGVLVSRIARIITQPVPLVVITTLLFPIFIYGYNLLFGSLGLAPEISIRNFYSFSIIWGLLLNVGLYFPVRFGFKFLQE